jgi:hypothetical protein
MAGELPFDPDKLPGDFDLQSIIPDLIEPAEGWRAWAVEPRMNGIPKLYSVTHKREDGAAFFWTPRQAAEADLCGVGHPILGGCTCGFYSAKSLRHLMTMSYHKYEADSGMVKVVGRVLNWGKIVEGSQGWRSQYSYPYEIFVPFEANRIAAALGKTYGVKVTLKNILKK